jgi:hypothetical protein
LTKVDHFHQHVPVDRYRVRPLSELAKNEWLSLGGHVKAQRLVYDSPVCTVAIRSVWKFPIDSTNFAIQ